eukprot:scaffold181560_cov48-Prasinocladus_malaysianus.AAC.4
MGCHLDMEIIELTDVRAMLQESPDLHIPDLQKQLLSMDSKAYGAGMTKFLIESTTAYNHGMSDRGVPQQHQHHRHPSGSLSSNNRRNQLVPLICAKPEVAAEATNGHAVDQQGANNRDR